MAPQLNDPTLVKWLSGVFAFVLTLEAFVFRQLNSTTGAGVLNSSEMERFNYKREELRRKIYQTGAIVLASAITLFIVGLVGPQALGALPTALVTGFLIGVGLNYVAVVLSWISQLSRFADHLRKLEQEQKDFTDRIKRLSEATKAG